MSVRKLIYLSSMIVLPVLYLVFYAAHVWSRGRPLEDSLKWDRLLLLALIILLEQLYGYRYVVSQKFVLPRDIFANIVNKLSPARSRPLSFCRCCSMFRNMTWDGRFLFPFPDSWDRSGCKSLSFF